MSRKQRGEDRKKQNPKEVWKAWQWQMAGGMPYKVQVRQGGETEDN